MSWAVRLFYILDKMTLFLHGLLLLSWCDQRASLGLALSCLASLNFDRVSLPASVGLFPRHLQRWYKTQETEIRPMVVFDKNKQGSGYLLHVWKLIWLQVLSCLMYIILLHRESLKVTFSIQRVLKLKWELCSNPRKRHFPIFYIAARGKMIFQLLQL